MKKVILILVFALTSFSMSANVNNEKEMPQIGCEMYAFDAVAAETAAYGTMSSQEWLDAFEWYFTACDDAGGPGNIADPTFL